MTDPEASPYGVVYRTLTKTRLCFRMSIGPVARADARTPPKEREAPRRDSDDTGQRQPKPEKPDERTVSQAEPHRLDVEA